MRVSDDRVWYFMILMWVCVAAGVLLTSCDFPEGIIDEGKESVPTCVLTSIQDPVRGRESLETYHQRGFLVDDVHLGWDISLPEGRAVYPLGCGVVRLARAAQGYGTLVVVIEHRLASGVYVLNGVGERVFVDRFLSIYGHLRPTRERGGRDTSDRLMPGMIVDDETIIGYIENGTLNGDGAEHLHLGVRVQTAQAAQQTDPSAWFRGYDATFPQRRWFTDPEDLLARLSERLGGMRRPTDAGVDARSPQGADVSMPEVQTRPPDVSVHDAAVSLDAPVSMSSPDVAPVPDIVSMVPDVFAPEAAVPPPSDVVTEPDVVSVPDVSAPALIRYEFRVRSSLRVTPPYRLHDMWWRSILCQNTRSFEPAVTSDGWARCEAERLSIFDGSVFLPDHRDWGDMGQIGTVGNVPKRCTPTAGAEWRITDLARGRELYSGPVSGLHCVQVGSQDRVLFPD